MTADALTVLLSGAQAEAGARIIERFFVYVPAGDYYAYNGPRTVSSEELRALVRGR